MRMRPIWYRSWFQALVAAVFILFQPLRAEALVISVDLDPGTAGVQSALTVAPGDPFFVDVFISGVPAATPLNAFEFDLDFNPSVVSAVSVGIGGFLLAPAIVSESNVAPPDVNFAAATLLPAGASGDGVLAQVAFNAVADGISALTLNDVNLSRPFGVPLTGFTLSNGSVTVASVSVSEPATLLLFGAGLFALVGVRRRMN